MNVTKSQLASYFDHTLLRPDATKKDIENLCEEARTIGAHSVCVNPCWVSLAHACLEGSNVCVCTVIGFPLGAATAEAKAYEAHDAIGRGATEIDMVLNVGALKSGEFDEVEADIAGVVAISHGAGALVKVILETCLLTEAEIVKACELSMRAGADFVKTSTGFSSSGARVEDVALMRKTVGEETGVKASGGIRTYEDACAMLDAGANRLGVSASLAILEGAQA